MNKIDYSRYMVKNRGRIMDLAESFNDFEGWTTLDDKPVSPEDAKYDYLVAIDFLVWYYDRYKTRRKAKYTLDEVVKKLEGPINKPMELHNILVEGACAYVKSKS